MRRRVYRLRWSPKATAWTLTGAEIGTVALCDNEGAFLNRNAAIGCAAKWVRRQAPSQLVVHNREGRVAFERTYRDDPARSKG